MREEFLWVEKYRPKTIDECILPKGLNKTFREFVDNNEIPNLLLSGTSGIGKTTIARALCEQLNADYILVNGSEDRNIDTLRFKIRDFASSVSLSGGRKVVILDEADYINPQSTQPALRGFIEEFSKNCRFIFTCNFANRIISPLHSRCSVIEFKIPKAEIAKLAADFMNRAQEILELESIKYEPKVLAELITKYIPDWRRVLNELQRYSTSGVIDVGVLTNYSDVNIDELTNLLKGKKFREMQKWVVDNFDNDPNLLFRKVYDNLRKMLDSNSIPQAVLTIADYSYKSSFVVDQEINMVACLTEIMAQCEFA
jgi:DNA polymerase III delta prime subunit